ncbi:hypothetical protein AXG93_138s1160 [Marchantia polymorpha subsp. ruderalis]|uniref:Uncharacterized protein n=1 Tax=Marchantia polymorpha subsp. ruderalis TaxID=1480154 RepID=A0A176VPD9_MARPO|nr:hypothetical protein AXG93_138s1160 [Marchantia polymorpha subsp. ruderalis]
MQLSTPTETALSLTLSWRPGLVWSGLGFNPQLDSHRSRYRRCFRASAIRTPAAHQAQAPGGNRCQGFSDAFIQRGLGLEWDGMGWDGIGLDSMGSTPETCDGLRIIIGKRRGRERGSDEVQVRQIARDVESVAAIVDRSGQIVAEDVLVDGVVALVRLLLLLLLLVVVALMLLVLLVGRGLATHSVARVAVQPHGNGRRGARPRGARGVAQAHARQAHAADESEELRADDNARPRPAHVRAHSLQRLRLRRRAPLRLRAAPAVLEPVVLFPLHAPEVIVHVQRLHRSPAPTPAPAPAPARSPSRRSDGKSRDGQWLASEPLDGASLALAPST